MKNKTKAENQASALDSDDKKAYIVSHFEFSQCHRCLCCSRIARFPNNIQKRGIPKFMIGHFITSP